jgi:hypothetical protein
LASAVLVFVWLKEQVGMSAATCFAVLLACNPLVSVVARQARGYGLAMALTALMIGAAWQALAPSAPRRSLIWVAIPAALAIFTLPVVVVAFLAIVPLLWVRHRIRALVVLAGVGSVSLAWYAANLRGLLSSVGQQYGEQLQWHGFLTAPFETLLFPITRLAISGFIDPFRPPKDHFNLLTVTSLLVLGALVSLGVKRFAQKGTHLQAMALWLPVLFTFLVLTIGRFWVMDRFVSFLVLPMLALTAAGIAELASLAARFEGTRTAVWIAGIPVAYLMMSLVIPTYERLTSTPIEAFKEAATLIETAHGPVLTNSIAPLGLDYYIDREVLVLDQDGLETQMCSALGSQFVVIDHRLGQDAPLDTGCLELAGYRATPLHQLIRGDLINVWIIS